MMKVVYVIPTHFDDSSVIAGAGERYTYKLFWIQSHSADWFRIGRRPTLEEVADYKKFENKYVVIVAIPDNLTL